MEKIQLIFPPSNVSGVGIEGCFVPNGILSIGNYLKQNFPNLGIEILDGNVTSLEEINKKIKEGNADLIGISSLTGNSTATKIISKVAKKNKTPLVLGNHHANFLYNELQEKNNLKLDYIDYIIEGSRGEFTFFELINALSKNSSLDQIPSLAYKEKDKFTINNKREKYPPLRNLSLPDLSLIEDFNPYFLKYKKIFGKQHKKGEIIKPINVNLIKGCSQGIQEPCSYCCLKDFKWDFLKPERYWEVLSELNDKGFNYFFETCNSLSSLNNVGKNSPKGSYLERLVKTMPANLKKNIQMMVYSKSNEINKEVANYFKEMNVQRVIFGFDSGEENTLRKGVNKLNTKPSDNLNASRILNELGIQIYGCYVPGSVLETKETLKQTYNQIMEIIELPNTSVIEYTSLAPMPGSFSYNLIKKDFENKYNGIEEINVELLAKFWIEKKVPKVSWEDIEFYKDKIKIESEKRGIVFGGYY